MTWVKIDDGWPNNPKVEALSKDAKLLYVCGLCYCGRNLTDGVLNVKAVKVVLLEAVGRQKHIIELHEAGLWDRLSDGYLVHDYLEYNPSREKVLEERQTRADAGRLGGLKSGESRRSKAKQGEAHASKQNGKLGGSTPSRPVKDQKTLGELGLFRVPDLVEAALTEGAS